MNIRDLRQDYKRSCLDEDDSGNDPIVFFHQWLDEAIKGEVPDPTAMSLSTVSSDGRPSSRMVLLKGVENEQFVFYTNYESRKGEQLKVNPYASLLFFWPQLERQVRIEGKAELTDSHESDRYFMSRPLESRLSALVSPQSRVISGRSELEILVEHAGAEFRNKEMRRPEHWGGYALIPELIEFWQGRTGRLHDRIRYRRLSGSEWVKERLAP